MKPHGNSHQNKEEHHLYAIFDLEEQSIYKYGVCGEPLNEDGSSPRAGRQVREFNRVVGRLRFTAIILETGISGRKLAEELEEAAILAYTKLHGQRPRGNPSKAGT